MMHPKKSEDKKTVSARELKVSCRSRIFKKNYWTVRVFDVRCERCFCAKCSWNYWLEITGNYKVGDPPFLVERDVTDQNSTSFTLFPAPKLAPFFLPRSQIIWQSKSQRVPGRWKIDRNISFNTSNPRCLPDLLVVAFFFEIQTPCSWDQWCVQLESEYIRAIRPDCRQDDLKATCSRAIVSTWPKNTSGTFWSFMEKNDSRIE